MSIIDDDGKSFEYLLAFHILQEVVNVKMEIIELNPADHGFRGTLYDPKNFLDKVIIVFLGSEGGFLPASFIAERFADLGYPALALYYFGGEFLPQLRAQIPMEFVEKAILFLKKYDDGKFKKFGTYGISIGSMIALMSGVLFDDITCVIAVSPTHVVTEGFLTKTKMTGNSFLTYKEKDIPFLPLPSDMKMYQMFQSAYREIGSGNIPVEKIHGKILLIASEMDESWPAAYSVEAMISKLKSNNFDRSYKSLIFKESGHLIGIIPDVKKHRLIRLILFFFRQERKHPKECKKAREQTENEIIKWLQEW